MKCECKQVHVLQLPVKSLTHRGSTLADSYAGHLVQKALAYIRNNCRRNIGPLDVAERLGVSRPLLDLRFRELLDTSVGKTIIKERLAAVCNELKTSNASVAEIAERFDYDTSAQLMRQFKRELGTTVRNFRLCKVKI